MSGRCDRRSLPWIQSALGLGVLFVFALASVLGAGTALAQKKPILVGASVAATGKYGKSGKYQEEGYKWWAAQVNKGGGLLGRKVKLVIYDDQSNPSTAVKLYERLITQDKVDLILGPYSSAVTYAASAISEKHGFPMVAGGAASTKIWKRGFKNVFMVYTAAEQYHYGVLDIAKKNGLRTVAIIHEDSLFPKAVSNGAAARAEALGMKVVYREAYKKGAADFGALLTKIKRLNPDILLAGTYFPDAVAIVRQMKELNVNPRMFSTTVGAALPEFYKDVGNLAEYVYGPSQWEPGMKTPGNRDFVQSYKGMFGREPDYHSGSAVAAARVLELAVRKAGSLDRGKIRKALLGLKVSTPFGAYRVDDRGFQTGHEAVLVQWQKGRKRIVWPSKFADSKPWVPTPPWNRR